MMIKKLDDSALSILKKIVGKSTLGVLQLQKDWLNIAPETWVNTKPIEIKSIIKSDKKKLVVAVKSSSEATLLHYSKKELIDKLNLYFGNNIFEEIILKVTEN